MWIIDQLSQDILHQFSGPVLPQLNMVWPLGVLGESCHFSGSGTFLLSVAVDAAAPLGKDVL